MASPAETLLAVAQAQLSAQSDKVDGLRNRAATVLASAGIVAGFFATTATNANNDTIITNLTLAAASLFGLGALLGVVVLFPIYTWHFAGDISKDLKEASTAGAANDGDQLALRIATALEEQRGKNRKNLSRLSWMFFAQCGLLGGQIVVEAVARALASS